MPVLAEAISVIIKIDAIERLYPGGWEHFSKDCTNETLCNDSKIARVGFMSPQNTGVFIESMEAHGMKYIQDGKALDITVVDQAQGPLADTDWLKFSRVDISPAGTGQIISVCQHLNNVDEDIIVPKNWFYEDSLSQSCSFVPIEHKEQDLEFLRHEDGVDVYLEKSTGKELYTANTSES